MLAGADRFVRALPSGYETLVGDGGTAALGRRAAADRARARVPARRAASSSSMSRPPTSIPSSADVVAEAVERLRRGRTVLLIAHRPELVAHADRVVSLDAGGTVVVPTSEAA